MCGRFRQPSFDALVEFYDTFLEGGFAGKLPSLGERYNIGPSQQVFSLRLIEGLGEGFAARWGLVPSWAKDDKIAYATFNARSETAATKPAFRSAFKRRRCLIPVAGYYEWTGEKGIKQPHYVRRPDGSPLLLYGLWEQRDDLTTCTVLTTEASPGLDWLHDRMPCIAEPEPSANAVWLDPEFEECDQLETLLKPTPAAALTTQAVSTYVNKVGNEGPQCVEPVET